MRRQEDKSHLLLLLQQMSLLPFLLVLFFTSLSLSPSFAVATYKPYLDCAPTPFPCGDLTINVSYPFLVKSRPDYCGYPGFNLTCEDDDSAMMIQIKNNEYQVKGVDYSNSLLTIVDPIMYASQSCPKLEENTTLDYTLFEYSDHDQNLTVFINCTGSPTQPADIECLFDGIAQDWHYWLDNGSLPTWWESCRSSVVLAMNMTAVGLFMSGDMSFGAALQEGFTVSWTAGSGWCRDCVKSGGFCGYRTDVDRPCFCPNELADGSCQGMHAFGPSLQIFLFAAFA